MQTSKGHARLPNPRAGKRTAFTLIELLVTIAIIAIIAGLVLPALAKAKSRGHAIVCVSNTRQLTLAWLLYTGDHDDRLPYNLGGPPDRSSFAPKTNANWVNNIMSWNLDADNTNTALITQAALGSYTANVRIYKCPSDRALSDVQRDAGWTERLRSYSMNAMVGHAGSLIKYGTNLNNPNYRQFFTLSSIPTPDSIFVFLDEHPDSINDGYFLTNPDQSMWVDLPASYHNGAGTFAFADGHTELHKWLDVGTVRAPQEDASLLPITVSESRRADFNWVADRTSVDR
jgi:prepilin-type N-terminal cleavage/methylation domain-containing protein/prepilin-type processing-associated H-X9-DG protein